MSNPITTPAKATTSASTAAIPVSSGQGPGPILGGGALAGTGGASNHPGNSTPIQGGQGQLAQLLQQAAAASGHGTNGNSVASLSSTIAASGLILLPPPPLTSKNLTIHTSLLSTKQQLMQQQQQLQQLHHAQLNAALKKQQQQHQRQIQLQRQQQYDLQLLSPEDCSPSALSDGTMGEGIERDGECMSVNAGEGDRALHSQPTTRSTTRVTSPTSAFAPGYPLLSSQGDGGMDHYPPPDQWNYTMTRYHASLIPLCQIEEPPTFYEGMDDHPPVETDNDDSDSFFLEERDIRERGTDRSRDRDRDREREYNNSDENISLSSIAKPHPQTLNYSHHDHTSHSQEHLQQHQERKRLQLQDEAREGLASKVLQSSEGQSYRTSMTKDEHDKTRLDQETALSLTKQQRQRNRTIDSSGEQIFFYDGPNLLHAKLHTGCGPDPVTSDGSAGPRIHSSTEPFNNLNGHSKMPLQRSRSHSRSRSRSGSRSRSRSITGNSVVSTRSRSHSRSTSGALSRTISGYLAKKDLLPSSLPPISKTRPSILMRGFSADSNSRSDNDQKNRGAIFATGLTTTTGVNESSSGGGTVRRKATAKERLVAMVTRGATGASTVSSGTKDFGNTGAHESSLPIKAHRNSMDERSSPRLGHSPILSQTHSRRQGSPSVGRAGYHEYVGLSTGTGASSPPDTMMGFPYNNSSLLISTDIARGTGTPSAKVAPTLRTSRSNKPRPFSVATMEKLMASNGNRHDAYPHVHKEEISPRQEKHRSLHPHDLPFKSQQPQYRQHQHSVSNDVLVRGNTEDVDLRSKIVSSGSHPLLSTLGSPSSPTAGGLSSPPCSAERRDSKGKEPADRSNERLSVSSSKALKTTTTPEPALNDLSSNVGAVLVHEHHIHHHYYCQHCPPLVQANPDDLLDLEQQYNNTAAQRHLRRRPESKSFVPNASEYRQGRPLILDTTMSASPTTEHGYGSFAPGFEDGGTPKHPIVQNKKKSILGTMSMTSSMRKRFFAEQKKEMLQQQGQGRRGSERQVSPLSSSISGFDREDEAYGPSGASTRVRRNQGRPLLEGLSDDDDEYGLGNSSNIQGTQRESVVVAENGQQEQQRAKFLSRLKRFLLRPSPFAKSPPTPTAGSQINSSSSTPATPIDMRAAATVRVTKTRWARSGNNLQDHLAQDDLDADHSSLEGQLFYYPSQRESRRRWTHQEMFEPPAAAASAPLPTSTTPRREKLGIRAQFQQQQPSSQLLSPLSPTDVHPHHHHQHHHHHHHHDHPPGHDHQHHQHLHLAQTPLTAQQQPPQSPTAAVDARSAADSNSRRSPKSAISVLSSLPMSISATTHEKELSDHDTPPTPCSTAPSNVATTKEMKNATAVMSFNNASAL